MAPKPTGEADGILSEVRDGRLNPSGDQETAASSPGSGMTRQEFLQKVAYASVLMSIPFAYTAGAAVPAIPKIPFATNKTGDGIVGPYGEVRIGSAAGIALPLVVSAAGAAAVMDVSARTPFARFGASTDATAITLTSAGVAFGKTTPLKWGSDTVRALVDALSKDPVKARNALLLRSALYTSYPVAVKTMSKGAPHKRVATSMAKGSASYGTTGAKCTTRTVTEPVTTTVTTTVEKIKTAEQQLDACYKTCQNLYDAGKPIEAGICVADCSAKAAANFFVDIVVGYIDLVTVLVTEVTRTVVTCLMTFPPKSGTWPNPWRIGDLPLASGIFPQPAQGFTAANVGDGIKLIKDLQKSLGGFLGPFTCLLDGQWSLAALDTPINFGGKNVVVPYGIKVCINAACATSLTGLGVVTAAATAWGTTLGVLAALSTDIAALGIPAAPGAVAIVAGLGGAATAGVAVSPAVAVAAIIVALLLLLMIYATAIVAQMSFYVCCTDCLADGVICIEHPSFAIALIKLATMGMAPVELIPPIVTC